MAGISQSWSRLYDDLPEDPRIVEAGPQAAWLYVCGQCYCSRQLTDGRIPKAIVPRLADIKRVSSASKKLLEVGLWTDEGTHFQQQDYCETQSTAEVRQASRDSAARRQSLHRDAPLREAIRTRDGDACRYCGIQVKWSDRRGSAGGTYDHVDPQGPNSLLNLVVCCRGCNSSKGGRTPEEAGMPLRPEPAPRSTPRSTPDLDPTKSGVTQEREEEGDIGTTPLSPPVVPHADVTASKDAVIPLMRPDSDLLEPTEEFLAVEAEIVSLAIRLRDEHDRVAVDPAHLARLPRALHCDPEMHSQLRPDLVRALITNWLEYGVPERATDLWKPVTRGQDTLHHERCLTMSQRRSTSRTGRRQRPVAPTPPADPSPAKPLTELESLEEQLGSARTAVRWAEQQDGSHPLLEQYQANVAELEARIAEVKSGEAA